MLVEIIMVCIVVSMICHGIYGIWEKGKNVCLNFVQIKRKGV